MNSPNSDSANSRASNKASTAAPIVCGLTSWFCMLVALVIPMVNIEMRTGMGLVLVSSCFVFSVLLSYTGFHVSLLGMKSNNPMTQATAYAGIIMTILLAFTLLATIGLTFYYASAPGSGPS